MAEHAIQRLQDAMLPGSRLPLKIRYGKDLGLPLELRFNSISPSADTKDQKKLKAQVGMGKSKSTTTSDSESIRSGLVTPPSGTIPSIFFLFEPRLTLSILQSFHSARYPDHPHPLDLLGLIVVKR
jgi:hypothetical protein